jgi:hypothetical protein
VIHANTEQRMLLSSPRDICDDGEKAVRILVDI